MRIVRTAGMILSLVTMLWTGLVLPAAASAAEAGPDGALPLPSAWVQLGAGESHWYAFYYAGDRSQIEVRLQAEPEDSVAFAVWTPGEIERWGLGLAVNPIGRGPGHPTTRKSCSLASTVDTWQST